MNNTKKMYFFSLFTALCSTLSASEWSNTHEIVFNNGEPATISVDATFGLSLSQQVVYNLLCLALGITGSGITYSGIKALTPEDQECEDDNAKIAHRLGWWKTSIGLSISIGSIIALFQYSRFNRLFNAELVITNST